MDARVAHGFHHLRNERPYLARGPISNKVQTVLPISEIDFQFLVDVMFNPRSLNLQMGSLCSLIMHPMS